MKQKHHTNNFNGKEFYSNTRRTKRRVEDSLWRHFLLLIAIVLTLQQVSLLVTVNSLPVPIRQCSRSRQTLIWANTNPSPQFEDSSNERKSKNRRATSSSVKNIRSKISQKRTMSSNNGKVLPYQSWRVYGIEVHPDRLVVDKEVESNTTSLHPAILDALLSRLNLPTTMSLSLLSSSLIQSVTMIRRSVDARFHQQRSDQLYGPRYVYVLDVVFDTAIMKQYNIRPFKHQPGRMEEITNQSQGTSSEILPTVQLPMKSSKKPIVIVVGAGPAGLFCALQLAKSGLITPIIIERGQPVETRGKDIGALVHRRTLNTESNFAFGEGGAGTWSDGKLTTRIGRNSDTVRTVLETFVQYGAPSNILVDGAPHLGTDNLVRLLRNMRRHLRQMGAIIRFGTKVTGIIVDNNITVGVKYSINRETIERNVEFVDSSNDHEYFNNGVLMGDAVVLATGHSARDVYEQLDAVGVRLEAKGFAVGFRVEHPQKLINNIQYGQEWGPSVITGKVPTDAANLKYFESHSGSSTQHHEGKLPVPSYRLATDKAYDGKETRGVYSFCMCPGGQIVPASTEPSEVCVNGMSFSRRDSLFANSALVVTVNPDDEILEPYRSEHGVLAGIAFQRDMEQRAAIMGGGNFVVPVQRVTDFLLDRESTSAPPSSYRLGVKPAPCHLIYPEPLVISMKAALLQQFDRQMPGFVCDEGLLHGVETRTSSPVRIVRDNSSYQAIGTKNLFPAGEGAGFAGCIVSAAVDGMAVAHAVLSQKFTCELPSEPVLFDRIGIAY